MQPGGSEQKREDMIMRRTFTENDMPELKGQFVDILEDALAETNAVIPNEDRDEAVKDGEDPEELAIIYGEDYDIIGDTVEHIILNYCLDKIPAKTGPARIQAIYGVLNAYQRIIAKAQFPDGAPDMDLLKQKITETFRAWGMLA